MKTFALVALALSLGVGSASAMSAQPAQRNAPGFSTTQGAIAGDGGGH